MRAEPKFLSWLAVTGLIANRTERVHDSELLSTRRSEPCNKRANKETHRSLVFLREVAGVAKPDRLLTCKETLGDVTWKTYETSTVDAHHYFGAVLGPGC